MRSGTPIPVIALGERRMMGLHRTLPISFFVVTIFEEIDTHMRSCTSKFGLPLLSLCFLAFMGCKEDNEEFIKEQAAKAKGTIPGSRTAQAKTLEEYYEITPGAQGAGLASGPRPDRGKGYPGAKK
jgi:hypothetical protein